MTFQKVKNFLRSRGLALSLGLFLAPSFASAEFVVTGGTVTLANNAVLISSNAITLSHGSLVANNSQIVLGSTWTRTNGTFTQGTSTVTFTGNVSGSIGLIGSSTFYSFIAATPGTTVRFTAGTTQYVTQRLQMEDVTLRSTTNNATWYLRMSGPTQVVTSVNVKDSNASGNTINATNSINSGNNTNWNFITVDVGERYWVASSPGNWNDSANWSLASGGTGGAQVPLSTHTVIFDANRSGNVNVNTTVTVATLSISGYTGIFNTQSYNLTVSSAFAQTSGTVQLGTSVFTLQGDFIRSGGNFSAGTSTLTFTGPQAQILTTGNTGFYHVVINKSGNTLDLTDALDINGNVTLTAGTLDTSSQTITVAGNWTRTSGVFTGTGSTVTFDGSGVSTLSGSTTFYALRAVVPTATLQFSAGTTFYATNMIEWRDVDLRSTTNGSLWHFGYSGSSQTIMGVDTRDSDARVGQTLLADETSNNSTNNFNWAFGDSIRYWVASATGNWNDTANWSKASGGSGGASVPTSTHVVVFDGSSSKNGNANINTTVNIATLTISGYTGTINTQGFAVTVSSAFTQSSGMVAIGTSIVTMQGDMVRSGGNFSTGISTIQFTGDKNQTLTPGATAFYHAVVNKTGGTVTLGGDLALIGQMTVTAGTFDTNASNHYASSSTLLNIAASGIYNANNSTITLTGTVGVLFTEAGTFNQGNSKVVMTPNSTSTLTSNNPITFHHLELSPLLTAARTYTLGTNPITINGDFTLAPNAASAFGLQVTLGSATVVAGDTYVQGSGLASSNLNTGTNRALTSERLTIVAKSTVTANASVITLNGTTGTLFTRQGTFTQGTSTVLFAADGDVTLTEGAITFNNLTISPSITADRWYETGTADWTVSGQMNIAPDKSTAGDATLTVNMGGAITGAAATVLTLDNTNNARAVLDTGLGANYSLTLGRIDIRTNATLTGRAATITLAGTSGTLWTQTGLFNEGNSVVVFNPNASVTLTSNNDLTFYDLQLLPTINAARAYTFGANPLTILGHFTSNPTAVTTARVLTVNIGSTTVVTGTTTVTGTNVGTTSLTLTASNRAFSTGNLFINTGSVFNATGANVTLTGATSPLITRSGTFTQGTSSVSVVANGDVTLNNSAITFASLVINSPNRTITTGAIATIADNLTISSGTLADGGFQLTGSTPLVLTMSEGSELLLGTTATATAFPTAFTTANILLNLNSTVTYNAGVNQSISATPNYANLQLVAPSGTPTKTPGAAMSVRGHLTIGSNNIYSNGALSLTIGGNYSNSGTFTAGTGSVTFNSSMAGNTLSGNMSGPSQFNTLGFNGTGDWTMISSMTVASTMTVTAGTLLGDQDITVVGGVNGNGTNGTINLSGGTFTQRVAANQFFGSNIAGTNNWTFNNLTFSNSSGASRTIQTNSTGSGQIIVSGTLSIGASGDTFATILNNQTNNRDLVANGSIVIQNLGLFQTASSRPLLVGGDWTNYGTFTTNNSTVTFTGTSTQQVNNFGKAFANLISSNTSAGGLVFSSSFSATRLHINTANLGAAATAYFAGRSTFTISTFSITGTASYPVVLRSTSSGTYWYLNNTSTHSVQYTFAEDSHAGQGLRIFDYPGGESLGHNINWAFGAEMPSNLFFSNAQTTSLSLTWSAVTPTPDSYTLSISTNQTFSTPATSVTTSLTNATTSSLLLNTTYYARINSVVQGIAGEWSADIATATLANPPASAASTWTAVNFTSVTVQWIQNSNPSNSTQYEVQLSTVSDFLSGTVQSSVTANLQTPFTGLAHNSTYYLQVKAINHSGLSTSWVTLGSTITLNPQAPTGLAFTNASTSTLTASWLAPSPAGDTYTLAISTDENFNGTVISSDTVGLSASNSSPLSANVTYYAHVRSENAGIPSDWSTAVASATLARAPIAAASTWTLVSYTSVTVNWNRNDNPTPPDTAYELQLSTVSNFLSGDVTEVTTTNNDNTFENLDPGTTYYVQARAVNHSGIATTWFVLGGTKTLANTSCNAVASGNWTNPSTWLSCTGVGGLPAITDDIIINSGVDVTLNTNATVQRVTFAAATAANNSLTQLSTVTLTANGNVVFTQPTTSGRTSAWNINGSTATVNGLITFQGTNATTSRVSQIVITSGELYANGGITFATSHPLTKVINMSGGAGRLHLQGALTLPANSATLTAGSSGSVFNFADSSVAQTIPFFSSGAYHNLHINNTSASGATLGGAITVSSVTGHVRVQSGIFKNGGFAITGTTGKTFEVSNGASFEMSETAAFPTGFTTTTIGASSRVRYLQTTTPLPITNLTYGDLDLTPASPAAQNFPAGTIDVRGNLTIGTNATVTAPNHLIVGGDWTNTGAFLHNSGTVTLAGVAAQTVAHAGQAFQNFISSNTNAGGVVFVSSFSAAKFQVRTADLSAPATIYFAATSTVTISSFSVTGTASYPVTLRSSSSGTPWHLNTISTYSVSYVEVEDSNATGGLRVLNYPGGTDLGDNTNWAFGSNPPTSPNFSIVYATQATVSWIASDPAANTYDIQISTNSDFSAPSTILTSALTNATTSNLIPNLTYYAQVRSIVEGLSSSWTSSISTLTLANIPTSVASTWTAVNLTSVTVSWGSNNNPAWTQYQIELSTANTFDGDTDVLLSTETTSVTFESLDTATTYHFQVNAVDVEGRETDWFVLGSTRTRTPTTCNASTLGTWHWTNGANWTSCTGPGGVPSATDIITINAGVNLVLNTNATVGGITFAAAGTALTFTQLSTVTLTVNGNVTMTQPTTSPRTTSWNINASTATVNGTISFPGTNAAGTRVAQIVITSGQLNANEGITFTGSLSSSKVINLSGGDAELNLKGNLSIPANSSTLTAGTNSIFNFADDTNQQVVVMFNSGAYNQLYLNNTSGGGVIMGTTVTATNVTGSLRVQSGLFRSTVSITGGVGDTFQVADGASFEMTGSTTFPVGYTTTTLGTTSRVRYLQPLGSLNVAAQTYGHLDLMPTAAATHTFPAGTFTVQGDLSLGNGTNSLTAAANTNNTTLVVGGNIDINSSATLVGHASNPIRLSGNWTNNGIYTHNNSTLTLVGTGLQTIDNSGGNFGTITSSNTSLAGVVFSSSFTAQRLESQTSELSGGTTLYFLAGATATASNLTLMGTAARPITLLSDTDGSAWLLNNVSSHVVQYVRVKDSNASAGLRILNYPGGVDLGGNTNWAIGLNAPTLSVYAVDTSSITYLWPTPTPYGDTYSLDVSTNPAFTAPATSDSTSNVWISTAGLLINTTYYARTNTVINGTASGWSTSLTTATWANIPASQISTWTVHITSITVAWNQNGNPDGTLYEVRLTTDSGLAGGFTVLTTTDATRSFMGLIPDKAYYAEVRAVNHSGIPTDWLNVGSTTTFTVNTPTGFVLSSATTNTLSALWNVAVPAADSYSFQVSTASNFSGTIMSSNTAMLVATTTATLGINTTYYGRLNAIINGSSSAWTTTLTTSTLANDPATAVSTWTAVNITSITVTWTANSNPAGVTTYHVQLSTVSNFLSGTTFESNTTAVSEDFDQLDTDTTYFGRVRAINHSGIPTNWLTLGSTKTVVSALPANVHFTAASSTTLTGTWDHSTPIADTYTLRVSTDSDFGGTVFSSTTANIFATVSGPLLPNTTYFGQARATLTGVDYPWSAYVTTATLTVDPTSAISTWTVVNITSVTVQWDPATNPTDVTRYEVRLTTNGALTPPFTTHTTTDISDEFTGLSPFTTYYAQVRAINHFNIPTNWVALGSTQTRIPDAPTNLQFTNVWTSSVAVSWTAPFPAGSSYTLQVATANTFTGTVTSSITANLSAATAATLIPNTTYFARINALVQGATSAWTTTIDTATLVNTPATAVSTWTAVYLTSITVNWLDNNNPATVTQYIVGLSTSSNFTGESDSEMSTTSLQAVFESLDPATQYFGRVKAVNHSGIDSSWLTIGSTFTMTPITCNATTTGNWESGATWTNCTGPGGVPSATDIITINSGVSVTLNTGATVGGITFASPSSNNAITHIGTNTLTVNGNVTFQQPGTSSRNNSWNINAGSATVSGLITFSGTNSIASRVSRIVLTTGELNAFGGITFTASANSTKLINMSAGASVLNLKGTLTIPTNGGSLLTGSGNSVFNYAGDSGQTINFFPADAYENLHINNASGSGAVLSGAITTGNLTGNLRVQSGILRNGGFAIGGNTGKTFEVADGATFEMSGTSSFPSGFSTTTLGTSSRVRYLQTTAALAIDSLTFGHLDLMPAAAVTQNFPAGTVTVQGDLSIGNGTTATVASLATNNTTLNISGDLTVNGNATFNTSLATVSFIGANVHTLTGSTTFYGLRATTAGGTMRFTSGATFYATNMVEFRNITVNSTIDGNTAHFQYTGSSQTLRDLSVRDSNALSGQFMQAYDSVNNGNNFNWDFGLPAAITNLTALISSVGRTIDLTWTAPGDDGTLGTLTSSTFTIQYTTVTAFAQSSSWSPTAALATNVYRVHLATTGVTPGSLQTYRVTGLTDANTYYFRVWTRDHVGNYSNISNGATNYATTQILSISLSYDTLTLPTPINLNTTVVISTPIIVTNDGNVAATFEFNATTSTVGSPWTIQPAQDIDQFVLWAIMNPTEPTSGNFGNEDRLDDSNLRCTSTAISNGSENCVSVPPGESRTIWFKLGMPTLTTTGVSQDIRITGTATVPD